MASSASAFSTLVRINSVTIMVLAALALGLPAAAQAPVDEPGAIRNPMPPELRLDIPIQAHPLYITSGPFLPTAEELRRVPIDPTVGELLEQLDDSDFAVRERASRDLVAMQPDRLQIYALLTLNQNLSTEQRYRLLGVLRESLVRTPRGALGIQSNHVMVPGAPAEVRITDLVPGLPAERVLRVGDRITHIDGEPMAHINSLVMHVQSRRPGDRVVLTVKRTRLDDQGRPVIDVNNEPAFDMMEIEVELGSAEMLRNFNQSPQPISPVESNRILEADRAARDLAPAPRQMPLGTR